MRADSLDTLLNTIDQVKTQFGPKDGPRIEALLKKISRRRFSDADQLIRFHEALLFIRAYPHNQAVLKLAEELLVSFERRVVKAHEQGIELDSLDYMENCGIAGTTLTGNFSYGIACWLAGRWPESIDIDWEEYGNGERMGGTLPRFLALLEEDALVEANIPYRDW
ncbi:MAG TPA: hypothetical protein VG778_07010, partial [Blastocatellia bacterium]|nr:hypothetical protein [Blastocatellia bacterium]